MTFEIRRALHSDAAKIINAHRRSIREVCAKDYNPTQIAAWSGRDFQEERWRQNMDREVVYVVSNPENEIFGFGHLQLKTNHEAELAGLYFAPEVIGKGLGKKLVAILFEECRKNAVTKVRLTATKTARAFYEKMGFQQLGELKSMEINGQNIECFEMEIRLS